MIRAIIKAFKDMLAVDKQTRRFNSVFKGAAPSRKQQKEMMNLAMRLLIRNIEHGLSVDEIERLLDEDDKMKKFYDVSLGTAWTAIPWTE